MYPVLFQIGSVSIYSYGFFVALALLAATWAAVRRAAVSGFARKEVSDLIFILFASGVIGARLLFIAQHFGDYRDDPLKIFSLREGGLVWYGGFIAAGIAGFAYAKWKRWPLLKGCDLVAPVLPLAHGIGRIGCFLNGCCYGKESGGFRHPVQLYEALSLFALSALLLYLASRGKRPDGGLFALYLLLYGVLRFLIEFWRGDQVLLGGLTVPQWMSLLLVAGSALLFFTLRKKHVRT
ncbi:MAG: prolipoprotein diacylglyceryl transferase [Candidatus Omnitrophota bacterium]